LKKLQNQIS